MHLTLDSNVRSNWSPKSTPLVVSLYLCSTLGAVATIPWLFNFLTVLLNGRKRDLIIKLYFCKAKHVKIEYQILVKFLICKQVCTKQNIKTTTVNNGRYCYYPLELKSPTPHEIGRNHCLAIFQPNLSPEGALRKLHWYLWVHLKDVRFVTLPYFLILWD